jgi:hypothetical protein
VTSSISNLARNSIAAPRFTIGAAVIVVSAALALLVGLTGPFPAVLRGWLLGFAIWSCVPIGSMTLLLIHRLTGGRWGIAASPVLRPAAALMPVAVIAFVPVLGALSHIYPWAADPGQIPHDVARWYLGEPWFILRALIALIGWSVLGVVFAAGIGGHLLAALGLAFFGLTISLVAVDWYLSIEPHYVATAFAAMIAIQQLLAALALTAALAPPQLQGKVAADIGGLMIATLLGVVYLEYMTFVVAWYGDLPEKAGWFLKRGSPIWVTVLIAAFIVGAVLPFAMLLLKSVRSSRSGLRLAGALILAGTALHFTWLLVPGFDHQAAVVLSASATLLVLLIGSALSLRTVAASLEARRAE